MAVGQGLNAAAGARWQLKGLREMSRYAAAATAIGDLDGNVLDMSQDTTNVPSFPRTWGCPRTMWLEID
jgi:hypothetical protein